MNTGALRRGSAALLTWLLDVLLLTVFGVSSSVSALASARGPASWMPQTVLVSAWSATYVWAPGSSASADGYTVVAPTGGAAGRWLLAGDRTIHWTGTGGDDSAALTAIGNALGAVGGRLVLHGTVTLAHAVALTASASTLRVVGAGGAAVVSTIAPAGPSSCPFYIDVDPAAAVGSTALDSTPGVGATSAALVAAVTSGQVLAFVHGTSYEVAVVGTVTGSGPYTIQLLDDQGLPRALRQPFVAGDPVEVYAAGSQPHDIVLLGLRISGSGAQMVEVARSRRILVQDCILAPSSGVTGLGFDEGCEDSWAVRVHAYLLGSAANVGVYFQSNRGGGAVDCTSQGSQNGVMLLDCYGGTTVRGGRVENCVGYGVVIGSLPGGASASFGCLDCTVDGVAVFACATAYFLVGYTNLVLTRCQAESCGTYGFLATDQPTTPNGDRLVLSACCAKRCGVAFLVNAAVTNTAVVDCDGSAATVGSAGLAGDVVVNGFTALGMTVTPVVITSARARLSRLNIEVVSAGVVAIQFSGQRAWVDASYVASVSSVVYYLVTGTLSVRASVAAAAGATGLYVTAGATARVANDNDLDATATPLTVAAGGYCSRGTQFTATGGAAQDIPWPDARSTDRLRFRLITAGGTPNPGAATYTVTPGSKFRPTFPPGDTSVYELEVA